MYNKFLSRSPFSSLDPRLITQKATTLRLSINKINQQIIVTLHNPDSKIQLSWILEFNDTIDSWGVLLYSE